MRRTRINKSSPSLRNQRRTHPRFGGEGVGEAVGSFIGAAPGEKREAPSAERAERGCGPDHTNPGLRMIRAAPPARLLPGLFLARVVGGVDVVDLKRPDAVKLDNGFSLGHREMAHGLGHPHEGTGRQFFHRGRIELLTLADQKRALQHRDVFVAGVPVGRDLVAIGQLGPENVRHTRFRRTPNWEPGGKLGGEGPHLMAPGRTTTWSVSPACPALSWPGATDPTKNERTPRITMNLFTLASFEGAQRCRKVAGSASRMFSSP